MNYYRVYFSFQRRAEKNSSKLKIPRNDVMNLSVDRIFQFEQLEFHEAGKLLKAFMAFETRQS